MPTKSLLFTALSALFSSIVSANVPQLAPLSLPNNVGEIRQFDVSETGELALINQQGELFRVNGQQTQSLGRDYSPNISPEFAYGRIAAADKNGKFTLWTDAQRYRSTITLSPNAHLLALRFATLAVVEQQGKTYLARLETTGEKVQISAIRNDVEVLPDARPVQLNLSGDKQDQGHIAVLAQPDSTTYQHGVIGDEVEAKALYYLERHSLADLAKPLVLDNAVFEANSVIPLHQQDKQLAVTVISGDHGGASTAVIGEQQGKLTVLAKSDPLPSHRWQSPFTYQQNLYAIQMPHLARRLVAYQRQGEQLTERAITSGVSNHKIGDHETNLVASTGEFSVLPKADYHHITLWNHKTDQFSAIDTALPARIIKTQASENRVFLLLENGQLWVVNTTP